MLFYIIRIYLADKYNHKQIIIIITIINNYPNNTLLVCLMPLYYYLYKLIYVLLPERSERLFLLISAMPIKLFNITKKEGS